MDNAERLSNSINRSFNGPIPPQFINTKFSASHPNQLVMEVDTGGRSFLLRECLAGQLYSVVDEYFTPGVLPDLVMVASDYNDTQWVLNVPFKESLLELIDKNIVSRALYGMESQHKRPVRIDIYDPATPQEPLLITLYRDQISNNGDEPLYTDWTFNKFHARCDEYMALIHELHMYADYDFIDDQSSEDFMQFVHKVSRMGVGKS